MNDKEYKELTKEDGAVIETTGFKIRKFIKTLFKDMFDVLKWVVIAVLVSLFLSKVVFFNAIIPSSSMFPTLHINDVMFCLRTDFWFDTPHRGDIVVFNRASQGDTTYYTKRVVGEPGDKIEIIDGLTYINDEYYAEPWLNETPEMINFGPYKVPEESYFCMGDNRNNSFDCRYWDNHFIPSKDMLARGKFVMSFDRGFIGLGKES